MSELGNFGEIKTGSEGQDIIFSQVSSVEVADQLRELIENAKGVFEKKRVLPTMRTMSIILDHSNPYVEVGLTRGNGESRPYAVWRIEPKEVPLKATISVDGPLWTSRGIMAQLDKDGEGIRIFYSAAKNSNLPSESSQQDLLRVAHESGYPLTHAGMDAINPSGVNYRWRELRPGQTFQEYAQAQEVEGKNVTIATELLAAYRESSQLHDGRVGEDLENLSGSQFGSSAVVYQSILK
jgi:hypothetical protein